MISSQQIEISPLRSKRYGLFWISSFFSNVGTWMQQVAQPWIILSLNPSSLWVGMDSFALNAPGWLFTLWGGILADRFDRKKVILIFQSVQALCVLALLVLLMTHTLHIWSIIILSFLIGTTDAFSGPALQSIIPSIVEKKDIPHAIALNSTQFNMSRVAGPALAGFIIASYGAVTCVGANLFSYLPFFLSIYWIYPRRTTARVQASGSVETVQTSLQFLTIFRDPRFRIPLLSQFATALFCGQLVIFNSVFIKDVFHAGAVQLGWSSASFGFGGVAGAMFSSIVAERLMDSQRVVVAVAAGLGGVVILISLAPSLWLFYFLLGLGGFCLTFSTTCANTILQVGATNSTRGKVASLFQTAMRGGMSLGGLITALLAAALGVRVAFAVDGILAVIAQALLLSHVHRSLNLGSVCQSPADSNARASIKS
jgi:MFS family permease